MWGACRTGRLPPVHLTETSEKGSYGMGCDGIEGGRYARMVGWREGGAGQAAMDEMGKGV